MRAGGKRWLLPGGRYGGGDTAGAQEALEGLLTAHAVPPQLCHPYPNLSNKFYLKAKHQLHRSPPGEDAMIGVADEEEVQDTQEEHKSCGDPQMEGSEVSTSCSRTAPPSRPPWPQTQPSTEMCTPKWNQPSGSYFCPGRVLGQPRPRGEGRELRAQAV